jgi:hypothetical protein
VQFGDYFELGADPGVVVSCPSLITCPEVLTAAAKTHLIKENVKAANLNLPLNYGFHALHELQDNDGPLRVEWWDMAPDALGFAKLETRAPTKKEKSKVQPNWLGKEFTNLTLYYQLSASGRSMPDLASILGLKQVKHAFQHQHTVGKFEQDQRSWHQLVPI